MARNNLFSGGGGVTSVGGLNGVVTAQQMIDMVGSLPVFYVEAYGAKVDGVTNDATAVAAAVTAATSTGGVVVIPAGSIVLGSQISVPSNVEVRGAGMGATIVLASTPFGAAFSVAGTSGSPTTAITISDLTIN